VGRDITSDVEMHGKLIDGNSYLIPGERPNAAIDLLIDLAKTGHKGLYITRGSPAIIKATVPSKNIEIILMSQARVKEFETIADLLEVQKLISDFSLNNENAIILLDGIHYLITRFSFQKFVDSLYSINDAITENKGILFLRIDPSILTENQLAIIENELLMLPGQKVEDLIIEDVLYDTLRYIYEQNQLSSLVSIKKLMSQFKIAYATAASRLQSLEQNDLIYTKRKGKLRTVYVSDKGENLLHKRKLA
jgi:predicted transcriptional regulator